MHVHVSRSGDRAIHSWKKQTACLRRLRLRALVLLAAAAASGAIASDGELHTFHCLFGCPLGAPATNDTVVRKIYTLLSNDLTKVADWVAYRVTPASIGTSAIGRGKRTRGSRQTKR